MVTKAYVDESPKYPVGPSAVAAGECVASAVKVIGFRAEISSALPAIGVKVLLSLLNASVGESGCMYEVRLISTIARVTPQPAGPAPV